MCGQMRNMIFIYLSISIIAYCNAQQESTEFTKSEEEKLQKQQESIEVLMKQVGDMGMLLENYRRVIVNGITESSDICNFIDGLSVIDESAEKTLEKPISSGDMSISLYKKFFRDINDPILKTQIFATLENRIDQCYNMIPGQRNYKRDKANLQKVRFHSWGGKRNRVGAGTQKIVIRTPFHAWGGKRSGEMSGENY